MIGIGTSAPGYKLDVSGDARFQGPNIILNCGILDVSSFNYHRLGNKIQTNILAGNTESRIVIQGGLKIEGLPTYDSEEAASSLPTDTLYKTSTGELRIKL